MEPEKRKAETEKLRLRTPERSQVELRMECPDDLVSEDHPVRMIWEVTGKLDLSRFYAEIRAREGQVGRNATDPRLLVSLWLYAATQGVGSARELARLCEQHRDYLWLCGGVSLNYHTLSDFRVDHGLALDELLTQLIAVLVDRDLVQVWRISQDGTRVRAFAGSSSYRSRGRLQELHKQATAHMKELRKQLEDPGLSAQLSARQRAARERAAREREQRIEKALERLPELESSPRHISAQQWTCPDSVDSLGLSGFCLPEAIAFPPFRRRRGRRAVENAQRFPRVVGGCRGMDGGGSLP